ncbi:MAG: gluconolactonase [Cereibacter sphaeroides]|uniref:Gluconolactonase n=1 Tax=Cereibacter sphaeroides TaxID=1063 RepID=A0A2W5TXD9_CERSP|nr:MAG: gluconolactonase [Cereibacter sphaeroides]
MTTIYDSRRCELGEGPLWHPERDQLFWFDILGKRLMTLGLDGPQEWAMGEMVSAAGWVDERVLLIASETALFQFDVGSGKRMDICALEADNPATRSNDGRADPQGGFWIGTMGKKAERGAGAIYRWYRGELRKLYPGISIPNSISFTPDGRTAHFADSNLRKVMRVALDVDGWPKGEPQVYVDLGPDKGEPDGAVVDEHGNLWLAEWGVARVASYAPDGSLREVIPTLAKQTSCPAFGGPGLTTLFITSALQGMSDAQRTAEPQGGMTFSTNVATRGQPERRVILGETAR